MVDITSVLVAKSDQINGPDLIGGPRVVKLSGVKLTGKEQATDIAIVGDDKLWRPCKTVVRLLARAWGNETDNWIGKSAQLYYDPDVRYGKTMPGGVRISHLSHLNGELTVCLQVRKGVVKEYTIKPLATERNVSPAVVPPATAADTPSTDAGQSTGAASNPADETLQKVNQSRKWTDATLALIDEAETRADLAEVQTKRADALARLRPNMPNMAAEIDSAYALKLAYFDRADGGAL